MFIDRLRRALDPGVSATRTATMLAACAACAAMLGACAAEDGDSRAEPVSDYRQGYALVYWQASKVKNIDKLLIVKGEREPIREITGDVARLSAEVAVRLEEFAATHEGIDLEREFLPPIEAGARDRMGSNIALELLFSGGCDFEQRLVFTEAVAVLRMSALAEEMQDRAPDAEQAELWTGIHEESAALFERVRDLINQCPQQ
jgi:hypothetical protein